MEDPATAPPAAAATEPPVANACPPKAAAGEEGASESKPAAATPAPAPAAAANPEASHKKCFVGGLNHTTDEAGLKAYFSKFGTLVDAVVMRDSMTKQSRGFGFITFSTTEAYDACIDGGPHMIDGHKVEPKAAIKRSESQNTKIPKRLFAGGLPQGITEEEFKEYFAQFGPVESAEIMYDRETKRMRGFGFITFKDDEGAAKCVLKGNHQIQGKYVELKGAETREQRTSRDQMSNRHPRGGQGMGAPHMGRGGGYPPPSLHSRGGGYDQGGYNNAYGGGGYGGGHHNSQGGQGGYQGGYGGQGSNNNSNSHGGYGGQGQYGGQGHYRSERMPPLAGARPSYNRPQQQQGGGGGYDDPRGGSGGGYGGSGGYDQGGAHGGAQAPQAQAQDPYGGYGGGYGGAASQQQQGGYDRGAGAGTGGYGGYEQKQDRGQGGYYDGYGGQGMEQAQGAGYGQQQQQQYSSYDQGGARGGAGQHTRPSRIAPQRNYNPY